MGKNYKKAVGTYIRTLYSKGFSSLMMSFYNTNLSFCFARYTGDNNAGLSQYDKKNLVTTTINYEGASLLHLLTMSILNDMNSEKEIKAMVSCNNAALIFEYSPDQNNQMGAYLTIDKNQQSITFRFPTHTYQIKTDGQMVTKVIQSGLGVFVRTIEGYLAGVGADRHWNKLPDIFGESQDENQQSFYPTGNNGGYQQRSNNSGYQHGNNTGYQQSNHNSYPRH